jgi:CDP-6-deoxy-D-xylo-4-hexulose-3-dehydrase
MSPAELKAEILRLTREYSRLTHAAQRPAADPARAPFTPGQTTVPYAGRVFDENEVEAAVGATLDFWLTLGPEGEAFERELAALLGVKHSLLVNSGSSANLVALAALTTHKLPAHRRIQPGDEVITVAAGFPTTVSPILQLGAVPVFIDNDPATGNLRPDRLEAAFTPGKTKAVMIAHALGNPFDLGAVLAFCRRHELWLVEDNCDALGCTYSMPESRARALGLDHLLKIAETGTHPMIRFERASAGAEKVETTKSGNAEIPEPEPSESQNSSVSNFSGASAPSDISDFPNFKISAFSGERLLVAPTGTWGDLSTQSFYPPHHLTMGEGGAVNIVSRPPLKTYAESFRDWGRDCWCASGKDDTCGKRFAWQLGELPPGYDHKYIYSHLGYNLKPLDPQAAIGRQQLKKLPAFIEARKQNWQTLRAGLADLAHVFDFTLPTHATAWTPDTGFTWDATGCRTDCSWFGFMLRVRPDAGFSHTDLARHLDEKKIGNRMFFGGNLLRQPVFVQLKKDRPDALRVVGDLAGADEIMHRALFLGTYPGLTPAMLAYEIETIHAFVRSR